MKTDNTFMLSRESELGTKNEPLATIIIPTYRKFDHLLLNIESVLIQTYSNIEIIVSDDGSGNFPFEKVRDFVNQNKRDNISCVQILLNPENLGTVRHANIMFSKAHGVVYIPLAQDDEFYSKDVVRQIMQRYIEKKFNILLTSRYGVNKEGEFIRYWPYKKNRKVIEGWNQIQMFCAFSEDRNLDFASGSIMNISAEFFKKVGPFDERYKLWEDGPFLHKVLRLGYKIETAYEIISIRYEQTEGLSNRSDKLTILKNDVELYLNTDFQIGINDYGYFHRRAIELNNFKRKHSSFLFRRLSDLLYFDVVMRNIILRFYQVLIY